MPIHAKEIHRSDDQRQIRVAAGRLHRPRRVTRKNRFDAPDSVANDATDCESDGTNDVYVRRGVYYARVVEIATLRRSTYDAI